MTRLIPAKTKPTIMAGELKEFFKNAPHLSEEEIKEFGHDIDEVRKLTMEDINR